MLHSTTVSDIRRPRRRNDGEPFAADVALGRLGVSTYRLDVRSGRGFAAVAADALEAPPE
jgi:hypothetical protein